MRTFNLTAKLEKYNVDNELLNGVTICKVTRGFDVSLLTKMFILPNRWITKKNVSQLDFIFEAISPI